MKKLNLKNVTKETWLRTALLVFSLVNMELTSLGYGVLPFDEAEVEQAVSEIFVVVTSLIAWWKNNSFTDKAQEGDKICHK